MSVTLPEGVDAFLAFAGWADASIAPLPGDPAVVSGESGAVTLGLLSLLMQSPALAAEREALGLDASSRVLAISSEGDTDPQRYRDIVWDGEIPSFGEF
mgnify:CR=1 FL=1